MIKHLWSDWLCCHYQSISIIKAMLFSRNTKYCSLSHAIPQALRNLQRLRKSRTLCIHKQGTPGKVSFWHPFTILTRLGERRSSFLQKGSPLRRTARFCAPQSLSHKDHTREPAISEIRFWVWEVADKEIDSKYICFHKSLLFSVLTAIKTTRN